MRIRWFGQSAFLLTGSVRIAIDPFGDVGAVSQRQFDYPPIAASADLLLITHEHFDHNAAEMIAGDPQVIRSTAGTFDSPTGEVRAIASEHDDAAGTQRGPNSIVVFGLDGLQVCHFGDLGQAALRAEQRAAIAAVDVLMLPVGGGPTVGGESAAAIVRELSPRLVIPMHYRTDAIDFLDPPDAFLAACDGADIRTLDTFDVDPDELLGSRQKPVIAVLTPPV